MIKSLRFINKEKDGDILKINSKECERHSWSWKRAYISHKQIKGRNYNGEQINHDGPTYKGLKNSTYPKFFRIISSTTTLVAHFSFPQDRILISHKWPHTDFVFLRSELKKIMISFNKYGLLGNFKKVLHQGRCSKYWLK